MFSLHDVVVAIDDARPLDGITLDLPGRGVTVILGASGSGKSTLLRLLNRLEVPTSGTVRFHGRDLDEIDPLALRRQVGMVFQRPTLFPGTVRDNLRVARPDADDATLERMLERVGLPVALLDRVGDDLSGGEAQRACLARTLITEPEVLLMDEVTSSLDPRASQLLEERTQQLAGAGEVPVVWVTHDLDQAVRLDPEPIVLTQGRLADAEERAAFLAGIPDRTTQDEGAS
ncbi:ATP-binding cassette domain-containing protein [Actinomarinicola tropica]|uniref:ATP-binding cassette domain-containing protein n=1 Tax=Actinomarinicola tropica TaxID=2789776 RepID=A0A5Q2RJW6_9ACTN|nr:ATP-binding cassette domain-containing protein [Actinomarinicola tropica]